MNWNIELYATENGDEPVMQFLNSLSEKVRAKAIWEINLLEKHGLSLKMPYVKNSRERRHCAIKRII